MKKLIGGQAENVKELNIVDAKKQEFSLLRKYRMTIDGGKIFRYCLATGHLFHAEYKKNDTFVINGTNNKELVIVPGSLYVEALNYRNAMKRVQKGKVIGRT